MAKRGLNKENIIDAAERLVVEKGYENFSLREVATKLGVQPASLYNHVQGLDEMNTAVAIRAAEKMQQTLQEAVEGKEPDEAFSEGVRAYRRFAMENPELYKAFVRIPLLSDREVVRVAFRSFFPLRKVIDSYGLSKTENIHFVRGLRAFMHGFIELTNNGFMQKKDISRDATYEVVIEEWLKKLKENATANKEESL